MQEYYSLNKLFNKSSSRKHFASTHSWGGGWGGRYAGDNQPYYTGINYGTGYGYGNIYGAIGSGGYG